MLAIIYNLICKYTFDINNFRVILVDLSNDFLSDSCLICKQSQNFCIKANTCSFQENIITLLIRNHITLTLIISIFSKYSQYQLSSFFETYLKQKQTATFLQKTNPFQVYEKHIIETKGLKFDKFQKHFQKLNPNAKIIYLYIPDKTDIDPADIF